MILMLVLSSPRSTNCLAKLAACTDGMKTNTACGELSRTRCNCGVAVFDEMRQGLKQLEAIADPAAGELRIGCPEITMAALLPAIIEQFSKQYPRVRLHVELVQTALLQFQELRERKIDLLIGRIPQTTADDLKSEMLFAEPFLVVAGNNSKWARRKGLKLADLLPEPWAPSPSSLAVDLSDCFRPLSRNSIQRGQD